MTAPRRMSLNAWRYISPTQMLPCILSTSFHIKLGTRPYKEERLLLSQLFEKYQGRFHKMGARMLLVLDFEKGGVTARIHFLLHSRARMGIFIKNRLETGYIIFHYAPLHWTSKDPFATSTKY